MHVKHHEEEVNDLLEYLDKLSYYRIEKMEESFTNGKKIPSKEFDELKTYLDNARSQLIKLQQKRLGQRDMIAFTYFRISDIRSKNFIPVNSQISRMPTANSRLTKNSHQIANVYLALVFIIVSNLI